MNSKSGRVFLEFDQIFSTSDSWADFEWRTFRTGTKSKEKAVFVVHLECSRRSWIFDENRGTLAYFLWGTLAYFLENFSVLYLGNLGVLSARNFSVLSLGNLIVLSSENFSVLSAGNLGVLSILNLKSQNTNFNLKTGSKSSPPFNNQLKKTEKPKQLNFPSSRKTINRIWMSFPKYLSILTCISHNISFNLV